MFWVSPVSMVLTAFVIRVAVTLVFYFGAMANRPWATYGKLDLALNRLLRELPRWGQFLLGFAVLATLIGVSPIPTNNYSELSRGIALGAMVYLVTTATSFRTLRSNPACQIAGFPILEMIGIRAKASR
ncbi:Uncharacterised protein [Mycobacteroides abscessus subsp. abscessus]|uniref:hypothetical protein n=1 Tax=Mycobacteroides abscessus TaxID=36809 RepID=UPI0009D1D266|nr:hypothetical protein [Mycobacteroides abscessus]MDO3339924.1 hypothetical protein [Mycobacteroides abscessus subsp. abscessus]SKV13234.1 Uncharacterised protein [Mycobacteroides abscessus subsp. abscessus]SKY60201.1 Uncharacterised protein [Mycobacteroides abscessus subsp. abscessus]